MPSPLCEINSTSLGGWTATENGVDVAAGETISIRLADTAGVSYWSLEYDGTDELVDAPTLTVDTDAKTASFTAPSSPSDGWALILKSTVGVSAIGKDANFALRDDYISTFAIFLLTPGGLRVGALNETQEGSSAFGWVAKINPLLRNPPSGGAAPTGEAGGNLSGPYPNPTVAKIKNTTITTAGGALAIGAVLRVTGVSTADWGALDLADADAVTGTLALANIAPGTNGQVLTTAGGVSTWATIVNANISSSAAIAVSKLAPGTNGQFLSTVAGVATWAAVSTGLAGLEQGGASTGQALIWSGSAWAPSTNFAAQNLVTTGTLGAGATTVTGLTVSGLGLGVVHSSGGGLFSSSTIVNADVSGAAAIAGTKIDPNFGAQNILTSGTVGGGAATFTAITDSGLGLGIVHSSSGGVFSSSALVDADFSGTLTVSKIAPGTNGQILATVTGAAAWATAGGDVTGAPSAFLVGKIKGTAVATAGGALTTGAVLRVTGSSTADWGTVDLANASAVSGLLPLANITTGTNGQILTVAAGVPAWSTYSTGILHSDGSGVVSSSLIVNADVSSGAAIAVSKLAAGSNGQFLSTAAGVPTWTSLSSFGQFISVANVAAAELVDTSLLNDVTWMMVRTMRRVFELDTGSTDTVDHVDVLATLSGTGRWITL